ncbi:MAG: TetR family transcriptional regulator [Streptosporangiales bacterium]|nr:TetR family transcriptional regulator [Streptosporangiales bacterium]
MCATTPHEKDESNGDLQVATVEQENHEKGDRWEARRQEIVDIAARLFAERGYTATGVAELCRETGLGKGSLYYYIGSKERLLAEIHGSVLNPLVDETRKIAASTDPPEAKLRRMTETMLAAIVHHMDHVWVFLHEWKALRGRNASSFRDKRRAVEDVLESILQEGVDRGDFDIPDLRIATLAWFGMVNYTYQWYRSEGRLSPELIGQYYHQLFTQGIFSAAKR